MAVDAQIIPVALERPQARTADYGRRPHFSWAMWRTSNLAVELRDDLTVGRPHMEIANPASDFTLGHFSAQAFAFAV